MYKAESDRITAFYLLFGTFYHMVSLYHDLTKKSRHMWPLLFYLVRSRAQEYVRQLPRGSLILTGLK